MGSRRTLILIVAVVVGLLSAFALYTYVGGIEDNANRNVERVEMFKIVQDIPKGTFGDEAFAQGLIEQDIISKEYLPATAITDPRQIEGLVAISDLPANAIVVGNNFVSQAESLSSFSSLLKNNEVAITISVDQVHGVAALLVPGDFVNMLVNSDLQGAASVYSRPARFLYQKIQILAVGQDRKLEPGETAVTTPDGSPVATGISSGLITFAVPAEAAQRIASVAGSDFYLTLVPKDYQPTPLPPLDTAAPLPGEAPGQVTPYGPEGRPPS
ncbi:MAG: Flp pilus assembly protein CpaB [Acidimicrobiia bacterium]|nr:Flp pilus assembly protein CpaB [Acidimicrobiia bacterium]